MNLELPAVTQTGGPGALTILLLDDEAHVRSSLARLDLGAAMRLHGVGTVAEAEALLQRCQVDVALVDQHLGPGDPEGLEWLRRLHATDPDCFRVIFTGAADLDFAVRAINGGVIDAFLTKPWSDEQVVALVHQGAEVALLRRHNRALLQELSERNTDLLTFNNTLERTVAERTTNLRAANERLQQQQQALVRLETHGVVSHLAHGMAHELNNPLAVIMGYAQRLRRGLPNTGNDTATRLDVILEEVNHCRELVDQLRRMAAPLEEDTVPLRPDEILEEVMRLAREAGRPTLPLSKRGYIPEVIAAPAALRRVFAEIVANAVVAGATSLILSGEVVYERAYLHLANDGTTPDEDVIAHATKPFFTTHAAEGARGLGLAVAMGLLRDQEGHIELSAGVGGGAMVTIQLPAKIGSGPVLAMHAVQGSGSFSAIEGLVLVVDDDVLVGELLADVLHDLGLRTILARTCAEARMAASAKHLVAVLADLNLPDGTGSILLNELLPALKLKNRGALITGAEKPDVPYPVLSKPFRLDQVAALMRSLLTPD